MVRLYKNQIINLCSSNMFAYNYIAEQYTNDVNWDIDKILIVTIDNEVQCENGFPNQKIFGLEKFYQSQ